VYDKHGKAMADKEGGINMEDAAGFFANVFGGERFRDYIGEISLMKEMTSVATTMMTDEEKAEVERQMNSGSPSSPAGPASVGDASTPAAPSGHSPEPASHRPSPTSDTSRTTTPPPSSTPSPSSPRKVTAHEHDDAKHKEKEREHAAAARRRNKMTPEQRKKLDALELERRKAMEARISMLTAKLIERLRPFVEAKHPGDKDDPETIAFEQRMRREADDLKLESFGVEVRAFSAQL
jgi:hypothetical protein